MTRHAIPDSLPLRGFRVLNLSANVPGPVAAARLRDLGADVVKIEPPDGDKLAFACPSWYSEVARGMDVRVLDLKCREGLDSLHGLLSDSDLLLTAYRPAALKRLGLDWDTLHARYSRLCQVAIVGYAPPDDGRPGHDLSFAAESGLIDPPRLPKTLIADLAGAERAVTEALALLLARERSGIAGFRFVVLLEAALAFAAPTRHGLMSPESVLGGALPQYRVYRARDGWVAVAALEAHFLERLCAELGPDAATAEGLERLLCTRDAAQWEAFGLEHGIPLTAVRMQTSSPGLPDAL